jgi:hypothetical protein
MVWEVWIGMKLKWTIIESLKWKQGMRVRTLKNRIIREREIEFGVKV